MQSIDTAYKYIRSGVSDLILAGGTEALSHTPLFFGQEAVTWFANLSRADSLLAKLKQLVDLYSSYFKPVIGLKRGLTDPVVDMSMGQTAEKLAYLFDGAVARSPRARSTAASPTRADAQPHCLVSFGFAGG